MPGRDAVIEPGLVYADEEFELELAQDPGERVAQGVLFVYVGPGFCLGVPARDLMVEDVEEVGWEFVRALRNPHTGRAMYVERGNSTS